MPYKVESTDKGFNVVNTETGQKKNKTPYKTRAEAMKYQRTLSDAEDIGNKGGLPNKKKKMTENSAEDNAGELPGPPPGLGGLADLLGGGGMPPMGGAPGGMPGQVPGQTPGQMPPMVRRPMPPMG